MNSGLLIMALAIATFCFSHHDRASQLILLMSSICNLDVMALYFA
jgi:hypothetical protein